jgi:hypothetical protein
MKRIVTVFAICTTEVAWALLGLSRGMIVSMGDRKIIYKIYVGIRERKSPRRRWENIKTHAISKNDSLRILKGFTGLQ